MGRFFKVFPMIISRSPLRISLGGGGTDLPSYYKEHDGFLVAAAINQYVYITLQHTFSSEEMLLRYSKIEHISSVDEIKHPIIREAFKLMKIEEKNIEMTSMADIPAGTGLGSSGSFTTALLKALYKFKRDFIEPRDLAELACHVELDLLKEPIGKQDQYIAAFGGITSFEFQKNGKIKVHPLRVSDSTLNDMEDNLLLFSTGITRSASEILKEQDDKSKEKNTDMINNLHFIKEIGYKSAEALEKGNLVKFGELMNEHWQHKKKRSNKMSSGNIDRWYDLALRSGAIGGKLIGAGGGGFLMFYTEQPSTLRAAMKKEGLVELRFHFDFEGTKLLQ